MMLEIRTGINKAIAIILVGELLLFPFRFVFSVPLMFLERTWVIQVGIGYCIVLLNLKTQTWPIAQRIIALVVALPLFCWGAISLYGAEQLRNTAQLGEYRYYFTTKTKIPYPGCDFYCNSTVPALYKCNSIGLGCVLVFDNEFMDISESGLVVDKDANELQLFLSYSRMPHGGFYSQYGLAYIYGKQSRYIEGSKEFGESIYYLAAPQSDERIYMLYKCNQNSMDCKRLPFEYVDSYDVVIDIDAMGKLSIVANRYNGTDPYDLLVYTYDINHSQPACQTASCTPKDK